MTHDALIRDLALIAEWLRHASPPAIRMERGSGAGDGTERLDAAVSLAKGRRLYARFRVVTATCSPLTARVLWWLLPRSPQLRLGLPGLAEVLARALSTQDQRDRWWPPPPPKRLVTPEDHARAARYQTAVSTGFCAAKIWGQRRLQDAEKAWTIEAAASTMNEV